MTLEELFKDKNIKPKVKTETISQWITDETLSLDELIGFAHSAKDPIKATCIEAIELVTKVNPSVANESVFQFVIQNLAAKAPRIKWESAKVIGNVAHLFPNQLDEAIEKLIENTTFDGTVVRWSAAFALGEILKLKTKHNHTLLPIIESIVEKEEKNSIQKIYLAALKKIKMNA